MTIDEVFLSEVAKSYETARTELMHGTPPSAWTPKGASASRLEGASRLANEGLSLCDSHGLRIRLTYELALIAVEAESHLGRLAAYRNDVESMETHFRNARGCAERYLSEYDKAKTQYDEADSALRTTRGRLHDVLVAVEQRLEHSNPPTAITQRAETLLVSADIRSWLGDIETAREQLAELNRLLRAICTSPPSLVSLDQLNVADTDEKRAGIVFRILDELLEVRRFEMHRNQIDARLAASLRDFDREIEILKADLADLRLQGAADSVALNIASSLTDAGRPADALSWLDRVDTQGEPGQNLESVADGIRGMALLALGDTAEAVALIEAAVESLPEGNFDVRWQLEWQLARAYQARERMRAARAMYLQAGRTIDNIRLGLLPVGLDSDAMADKIRVFADGVALCALTGDAVGCGTLIELAKARGIVAIWRSRRLLGEVRRREANRVGDLGAEQELTVINEALDALDYATYSSFASTDDAIRLRRGNLVQERRRIVERMRLRHPGINALTTPPDVDLERTRSLLAARGAAAMTMFFAGDIAYAALLDSNGIVVSDHRLDATTQQALTTYDNNVLRNEPNKAQFDIAESLDVRASDLVNRDFLLQGLRSSSLVVIPHAALHGIPWSTLVLDDRRLFEFTPVTVLPSTGLVGILTAAFPSPMGVALIGAPDNSAEVQLGTLPAAVNELRRIASLYESGRGAGSASLVTGPYATPAAFCQLAQESQGTGRILHVACHAATDPDDPMGAGLLLEGGKLDASEISSLALTPNEVVLSACRSVWRPYRLGTATLHGDEMLGLPASFMEAGVATVVGSVHPVGDFMAEEFAVAYHEYRMRGLLPAKAFQQSQLQIQARHRAAFEWVGFTLFGWQ